MAFKIWVDDDKLTNVISIQDFETLASKGFQAQNIISATETNTALRQANLISVAFMNYLGITDKNARSTVSEVQTAIAGKIDGKFNLKVNLTDGELANTKVTFTAPDEYNEISSGEATKNIIGKIAKRFSQLGSLANKSTITASELSANAVETAKIKDKNVTTAKIDDKNVTTVKLADKAITTAKIDDKNVTTEKMADQAVTTAKIKDKNVTTAKIEDLNVTKGKLATDLQTEIDGKEKSSNKSGTLSTSTTAYPNMNLLKTNLDLKENLTNKKNDQNYSSSPSTTKYPSYKGLQYFNANFMIPKKTYSYRFGQMWSGVTTFVFYGNAGLNLREYTTPNQTDGTYIFTIVDFNNFATLKIYDNTQTNTYLEDKEFTIYIKYTGTASTNKIMILDRKGNYLTKEGSTLDGYAFSFGSKNSTTAYNFIFEGFIPA